MKLSIITINYNDLAGLKNTVDSVMNQSWKEYMNIYYNRWRLSTFVSKFVLVIKSIVKNKIK